MANFEFDCDFNFPFASIATINAVLPVTKLLHIGIAYWWVMFNNKINTFMKI